LPPRSSAKAVAVLILGIAGLVFTCAYGFGVIAAIVALVLAPGAKREIQSSQGTLTGEGMIKAGVICSWLSVALAALGIALGVLLIMGADASPSAVGMSDGTIFESGTGLLALAGYCQNGGAFARATSNDSTD
jgi:hypothetical protein